jgi:hypothetical protein
MGPLLIGQARCAVCDSKLEERLDDAGKPVYACVRDHDGAAVSEVLNEALTRASM